MLLTGRSTGFFVEEVSGVFEEPVSLTGRLTGGLLTGEDPDDCGGLLLLEPDGSVRSGSDWTCSTMLGGEGDLVGLLTGFWLVEPVLSEPPKAGPMSLLEFLLLVLEPMMPLRDLRSIPIAITTS